MINISFTKNNYTVDGLYQWDYNQTMVITGVSLSVTPEVHFAHDGMKMAICRAATMDAAGVIRVKVPNNLLQKASRINAYLCITEGETFRSLYKIVIPVQGRPKPSDYEGENEVEVYSLDALDVEVSALEHDAEATVEKVLQPDGSWQLRFGIPRGKPGRDGTGIGDMEKSVYDPQGKNQDVFAYVDDKVDNMEVPSGSWADLTDKPASFPPSTHSHSYDSLTDKPASFPPSTHSHSYEDLTDKPILCNPNLLDNWYLANPVNQKGQTRYEGVLGYSIDRWRMSSKSATSGTFLVEIMDGGVKFTNAYGASSSWIRLPLEKPLPAGTYTLSVLAEDVSGDNQLWFYFSASNGTAISNTSGVHVANGLASVTRTFTDGQVEAIWMTVPVKGYAKIKAVKLEVGSTQTLAHQENGEWVLNEIPNYGEELRKCQRHMFVIKAPGNSYVIGSGVTLAENKARFLVPIPVTMRVTPALKVEGGWSITSGSTYQSLRDHTDEAPALELVGVTENGAHLLAYAKSTVSSGLPVLLRGNSDSAMLIFDANL